jgi:hypothetical protein
MADETVTPPFEGGKYKERILTVEAVQFNGENGEDLVSFLGGKDYAKVAGDTVEYRPGGKDPRSAKIVVERGQWAAKSASGTSVVNEGEFAGKFVNEDGSDVAPLEPAPLPDPVPEDELEYQPGFGPPPPEAPVEGGGEVPAHQPA